MTFLSQHLPFPTASSSSQHATALPPAGSHLIITDTLLSPGQFALYHLISAALSRKQKVIWVDFKQEGRASLEAVLRKMSVVLPSTTASFTHIAPSSLPASIPLTKGSTSPRLFSEDDIPTLRPTYNSITAALVEDAVVILDGLSELLNMGFSAVEVHRFVRAVDARTRKRNCVLISTQHISNVGSESTEEHDLLERLLRIGTGWWRIEGLSSGRSGDVHGEISSFPLVHAESGWTSVTKAQPLQYRLEASTVKVFPKGTGRGYL